MLDLDCRTHRAGMQADSGVGRVGGSFKNNKGRFIDLNIVIAVFIASTCSLMFFLFLNMRSTIYAV